MAFTLQVSNYLANKLLNEVLGATAFTPPASVFIRSFSTILGADGSGSEISALGYEALEIDNDTTNFPATTTRAAANAVAFETSEFEEDCTIRSFGIFDADTGGNLLFYANFNSTPIEILSGQTRIFGIGDITLSA